MPDLPDRPFVFWTHPCPPCPVEAARRAALVRAARVVNELAGGEAEGRVRDALRGLGRMAEEG